MGLLLGLKMRDASKVVRFRRRRFRPRRRIGAPIKRLAYIIALFLTLMGIAQLRVGEDQNPSSKSIIDDIASWLEASPDHPPAPAAQRTPQSSPNRDLSDRRASRPRSFPTSQIGQRGRERCRAELPPKGESFSGPVTDILDGDSLCVGHMRGGVEVRLGDFRAPELFAPGGQEAKAALARIAQGKTVDCRAGKKSYDRIVSICALDGRSLGDLMREAGIAQGGK